MSALNDSCLCSGTCSLDLADYMVAHRVAALRLVGINICTSILGSLGNLLVCIAVFSTKGVTSSFHYFISSLAAADLVIALVVQPLLIALIIAQIKIQCLPDGACLVFRVVSNFAGAVSLLTLALIGLDRTLIVSPHLDYKNTMTARKKIVLAVVWALACACSAIRLTIEKEITSYLTAAVFGLCYVEMIVCYAVVYYRISKRRKRPAAMRARTELRGTRHEAAEVQLLKTENIAKERRFARTIVMVLVVFTGGWSYLFYLRLTQPEKNYGIRYDVARTVAFSASAINPALYCFNNKEYRRAFKRILSSFPFGWRHEEYERIL
ncbi:alpha-1D adrenergic receptor-like [Orbicella faveolata]|uniref:alpha-1D adrenergic receptor-like n=1 Tax=Orbicella faveolata TaxID=48498 RepID=UPI0009E1A7BD|nr:alpha-1D adrenergic receptor-like [Orbicella faveolata]